MSSLPILSVEIISEKHIIVGGSGPISTKYNTRDARKEPPVTYHFKCKKGVIYVICLMPLGGTV